MAGFSGSLASAFTSKTYASIGTDQDLVALKGRACRAIRCSVAGNVSVIYPDGSTDIVPFAAGETQNIGPSTIVAATTTAGAGLTVYW